MLGQITDRGVVAVAIFGVTTPGADDFTLVEKRVRDPNCLCQQPAGIVAQVQNKAIDQINAAGGLDLLFDTGFKVAIGLVVKSGDAQDHALTLDTGAHSGEFDGVANNGDIKGLILAFPYHGDDNLRANHTAHHADRLIKAETQNAVTVNMGDEIPRLNTGLISRGVVDRRDDFNKTLFLGDFDAKTTKFAPGLNPHIGGVFW